MKATIFTAVLFFLWIDVFAEVPQKMSYQAVVRDATGSLVTNTPVGMRITILKVSLSGTTVYTEMQTPVTNANGLATIEIGGGTGFDAINWGNGNFYIKTEIDPLGGTACTLTGTSQLMSVPYALYAKDVQNNNDADADATNELQKLTPVLVKAIQELKDENDRLKDQNEALSNHIERLEKLTGVNAQK